MAKKLFELLVVEGQLKSQSKTLLNELATTFRSKRHLFEEKRVSFLSNDESAGSTPVIEEQKDIQSTVNEELKWFTEQWTKALDVSYQVAEGNTKARGNVVLDNGQTLLSDVPATALLELEKRAAELQELLSSIPTLDPAKSFQPDEQKGNGYYKAREVRKTRTKKVQEGIVLYPATEEHPAQTQLISVDKPVGTIIEQEWSGMITPARKADLLAKVEEVRRALKAALHRANAVEMPETLPTCGKKLFDYVLS